MYVCDGLPDQIVIEARVVLHVLMDIPSPSDSGSESCDDLEGSFFSLISRPSFTMVATSSGLDVDPSSTLVVPSHNPSNSKVVVHSHSDGCSQLVDSQSSQSSDRSSRKRRDWLDHDLVGGARNTAQHHGCCAIMRGATARRKCNDIMHTFEAQCKSCIEFFSSD